MSRDYKNDIGITVTKNGVERRKNLSKEVLKNSTPFPKTVTYEDIDREFKSWVENELNISFDGKLLPTMFMVSNQRFSEYIESWQNVDEQKNMLLNFKIITRENNPKYGTLNGDSKNIPGNPTFLMKRVKSEDKNGRKYYIDYRMSQPFLIDLIYTVTIVTNKFELLNNFNLLVNGKFKAIDAYIRPNGHFMPMKLLNISDESEYTLNDRRFYSQSYQIKVMSYIITDEDFKVEEKPALKIITNLENSSNTVEIEEMPCIPYNPYEYKKLKLIINIGNCDKKIDFKIDTNFRITDIQLENIRWFEAKINGQFAFDSNWNNKEIVEMKINDFIKIVKISKYYTIKPGIIIIEGIDWTTIYNKNNNEIISEEITIK